MENNINNDHHEHDEHLKNLLMKINKTNNKNKDNLVRIAHDKIFLEDEKQFDLVLSQSTVHSQNVIYQAIKEGVNSNIMYLLMSHTDGYIKQQRILKYSKYQSILGNETILNDMLNIKNEYVEGELFDLLRMNKLRSIEAYSDKKNYFSSVAKFKGLFKKEEEAMSEIDYQELKNRRILKDNVLNEVKSVLRNFGFLGIDIPRIKDKNQERNDIANSFNKGEYQKLFNIDYGDDRLFVNGTITNPKSDRNFVELIIIFKELIRKHRITNYNINIFDKGIYDLTTKYHKDNVSLVSDASDIVKITTDKGVEFINISKVENNIVFNIKIDKLVDYIVAEKKENTVNEENLRDTIIYVDKAMEEDRKLYDTLIDKYLYEYHAIIAYEEDIPSDKLCNYCVENNIRFVAFLGVGNHLEMKPIEELIKGSTLTLRRPNKGEGDK